MVNDAKAQDHKGSQHSGTHTRARARAHTHTHELNDNRGHSMAFAKNAKTMKTSCLVGSFLLAYNQN